MGMGRMGQKMRRVGIWREMAMKGQAERIEKKEKGRREVKMIHFEAFECGVRFSETNCER